MIKLFLYVIKHHAMTMYDGMEVQLNMFITSALHGNRLFYARPLYFLQKSHQCLLHGRLVWPQKSPYLYHKSNSGYSVHSQVTVVAHGQTI